MRFVLPALVAAMLGACTSLAPVTATGTSPSTTATVDTAESPTVCVEAASPPDLPDLTDIVRYPERITEYLSSGGDVDRLAGELRSAGLLPADPQAWPAAVKDLDGNGRLDVAMSIQDPALASPRPAGSLFLWTCQQVRFELTYRTQPETDHSAPMILAAGELTGDTAAELVFGRPACGAHTCFLAVGVLQWDGDEFVDRWQGTSEDLPTPSVTVTLPDADRPAAITITSGGVQSVGAGPPRPRTRRWLWNLEAVAFLPDTDIVSPPVYRIHVIHDADRAFREGEYATAEELYLRAVGNAGTLDWAADPASRANLEGYARYRLVLNALAQGRLDVAEESLDLLAESSAGDPSALPFFELARRLMTAYRSSTDLGQACAAVVEYARAHTEQVVDPLYYGYDNPIYTAEDLCPFGGVT